MNLIMGSNASIIDASKPWGNYTQDERLALLEGSVPMANYIVHNCPGRTSPWEPPIAEAISSEMCADDNVQRMLNSLDVEATQLMIAEDPAATEAAISDMLNDPSFERGLLRL